MAYSTPADVRKALVPTSDGSQPNPASHTAADMTDAQLLDAIAEADAMIDGYLGRFYAVPVAQSGGAYPTPLPNWSRSVAAYLATCTFRGSMDFTENDPVARRYKDVVQALRDVAGGKMTLQLPQNTSGNAAAGAGAPYNPYAGDLWTPDDFGLTQRPLDHGEPYWRNPW